MRILDIKIPSNPDKKDDDDDDSDDNQLVMLPSYKGKLVQITHYARVRLDWPFATDPFVVLPFRLVDGVADGMEFENYAVNQSTFASPFDDN